MNNERLLPQLNPEWPPQLNKYVKSQSPNISETFVGKVIRHIWGNTGTIILLLNHLDYEEKVLDTQKIFESRPNGRGLFLIIPTYAWNYISVDEVSRLGGQINKVNQELHADPILKKYVIEKKLINMERDYLSNDLLTNPRTPDLDTVRNVEIKLNDVEPFNAPSINKMNKIIEELKEFRIPEEEIVVNKNIAINNLITAREDEFNEGNKIIAWLKSDLIKNDEMYKTLKVDIKNGYLYIARKGIRTIDLIEKHRVPDIHRLDWQYNKPIDYQSLKQNLFINRTQLSIKDDKIIQNETEKILSQEYILCIQPQPKYQLWALKRLIMAWYGDVDLQNNIRMIKILINQFRVDKNQSYNHKNGILPSIMIYTRYGTKPARNVLTKINYYFSLYTNIGVSTPTYFMKVNNMLFYTNGSIDLKLYFRSMMTDYSYLSENHSFNDSFTSFKNAETLTKN